MKKFLTSVATVLLLAGCTTEFDDSAIKTRLDALETRVTALEGNIQSLQSAIGEGVFVAKVQEYADPDTGKTIGITVTYTNGDVKYFEITPKANYNGPVLGVIKSGSGNLVWAIDGVAIIVDGKEVPVYQTPVFTIDEDGNLLVSIDGSDPVVLGQVQNEGATLVDGIFTDIKVEQDKIVLTLSDGTKVNIPFAEAFKLNIETTEFVFSKLEAIEIPYTVTAKTANTVVGVAGYSPKEFSVEVAEDKIVITPLSLKAAGVLLAYADSKVGLTSLVNLTIEAEGLEVTDKPFSEEADYIADGEDGVVVANVVSNVEFDVKPVDEWIHLVSVKATAYSITLSLDNNTTGAIRVGQVNLTKKGTDTVIQTITIAQNKIVEGPKNLSKKGPANSYIVTAPGDYMFWTVKGNSDQVVGEVATAEVLWETYNNAEAVVANSVIAEVSYANNYILFSTPETLKPGNAVIAAKDADGKILWSWHIWIPATEITTITSSIWDAPLMDRNLGALVVATADANITVESFGLSYQWGRKDPFVGAAVMGEDGNATVAGIALGVTEGAGEADESKITLEQSIENPTLLGHAKNKDWLTPFDNTLWQNDVKTIYDPCPAGYRVPARNKEQLWHGSDLSTVAGWAEDTNWFTLGDPAVVFPYAGYRDDYGPAKICHAYDRAVYWTAYASAEDGGTAYYVNVRKANASYRKLSEAGKSRAGSVRCVAFDETGIVPPDPGIEPGGGSGDSVTDLSKDGSANSYIVTKAGDYKFAAVKGNSTDVVAAAKAELVWETNNTATAPEVNGIIASVEFKDGFITFSTPETLVPGNALIAAKDANDVILWSWHIWIPADDILLLDGTALCGANIMDRNLGALVAASSTGDVDPLSIGLYYQWGRKDPFPGMSTFASNSGAAVAGEAWTAHGEHITTEYSIQHPTEYAHVKDVDEGVWNVDDPKDLWNTSENKKTIYDPCPAGYRVPLYDSSLPMWAGNFDNENWTIGDANRFSFGDIVFPIAGYIDCWTPSYAKVGERTHVWASSWYDDTRSNCMYYRGDKSNKYYSQKFHKAKAGSVRCVAE